MTPLGECFVFYFKYQPEMHRLYWKQKQQEEEIDPETQKMIEAVGDQCCREVGDFLTVCETIAEKHFASIGNCVLDKRSNKKWTVSYGVWPESRMRPQNDKWKMQIGFDIPKTKPEIIPWVWAAGKEEAEKKLFDIFGDTLIHSSEVDMPAGQVALARIPLLPEKMDGFHVDRDELLKQVEQAFLPITRPKFESAYCLVTDKYA